MMTAAELYEVVKDVPREAWPNGICYDWNLHGPKRAKHWHELDMRVSDVIAEHAFIGSMTAWLMERGESPTSSKYGVNDQIRYITVLGCEKPHGLGTSLVAALAAACKEAA